MEGLGHEAAVELPSWTHEMSKQERTLSSRMHALVVKVASGEVPLWDTGPGFIDGGPGGGGLSGLAGGGQEGAVAAGRQGPGSIGTVKQQERSGG